MCQLIGIGKHEPGQGLMRIGRVCVCVCMCVEVDVIVPRNRRTDAVIMTNSCQSVTVEWGVAADWPFTSEPGVLLPCYINPCRDTESSELKPRDLCHFCTIKKGTSRIHPLFSFLLFDLQDFHFFVLIIGRIFYSAAISNNRRFRQ